MFFRDKDINDINIENLICIYSLLSVDELKRQQLVNKTQRVAALLVLFSKQDQPALEEQMRWLIQFSQKTNAQLRLAVDGRFELLIRYLFSSLKYEASSSVHKWLVCLLLGRITAMQIRTKSNEDTPTTENYITQDYPLNLIDHSFIKLFMSELKSNNQIALDYLPVLTLAFSKEQVINFDTDLKNQAMRSSSSERLKVLHFIHDIHPAALSKTALDLVYFSLNDLSISIRSHALNVIFKLSVVIKIPAIIDDLRKKLIEVASVHDSNTTRINALDIIYKIRGLNNREIGTVIQLTIMFLKVIDGEEQISKFFAFLCKHTHRLTDQQLTDISSLFINNYLNTRHPAIKKALADFLLHLDTRRQTEFNLKLIENMEWGGADILLQQPKMLNEREQQEVTSFFNEGYYFSYNHTKLFSPVYIEAISKISFRLEPAYLIQITRELLKIEHSSYMYKPVFKPILELLSTLNDYSFEEELCTFFNTMFNRRHNNEFSSDIINPFRLFISSRAQSISQKSLMQIADSFFNCVVTNNELIVHLACVADYLSAEHFQQIWEKILISKYKNKTKPTYESADLATFITCSAKKLDKKFKQKMISHAGKFLEGETSEHIKFGLNILFSFVSTQDLKVEDLASLISKTAAKRVAAGINNSGSEALTSLFEAKKRCIQLINDTKGKQCMIDELVTQITDAPMQSIRLNALRVLEQLMLTEQGQAFNYLIERMIHLVMKQQDTNVRQAAIDALRNGAFCQEKAQLENIVNSMLVALQIYDLDEEATKKVLLTLEMLTAKMNYSQDQNSFKTISDVLTVIDFQAYSLTLQKALIPILANLLVNTSNDFKPVLQAMISILELSPDEELHQSIVLILTKHAVRIDENDLTTILSMIFKKWNEIVNNTHRNAILDLWVSFFPQVKADDRQLIFDSLLHALVTPENKMLHQSLLTKFINIIDHLDEKQMAQLNVTVDKWYAFIAGARNPVAPHAVAVPRINPGANPQGMFVARANPVAAVPLHVAVAPRVNPVVRFSSQLTKDMLNSLSRLVASGLSLSVVNPNANLYFESLLLHNLGKITAYIREQRAALSSTKREEVAMDVDKSESSIPEQTKKRAADTAPENMEDVSQNKKICSIPLLKY